MVKSEIIFIEKEEESSNLLAGKMKKKQFLQGECRGGSSYFLCVICIVSSTSLSMWKFIALLLLNNFNATSWPIIELNTFFNCGSLRSARNKSLRFHVMIVQPSDIIVTLKRIVEFNLVSYVG